MGSFPGIKAIAVSPFGFPKRWDRMDHFLGEMGRMRGKSGVFSNGGWRDAPDRSLNPQVQENEDPSLSGEIPREPKLVLESASTHGYTPIICFAWHGQMGRYLHLNGPTNPTNDWSNEESRLLFQRMLVDLAESYRPPFLFFGNENSFYYPHNPDDYMRWVAFYEDAYERIKAASPETQVGTVFNYEHLAGNGELVGWESTTYWEAIDCHDLTKIDVLGLTVYPYFHFPEVGSFDPNYLDPIFERVGNKPIGITETGWPSVSNPGVWESNEVDQATYVERFFTMLEGRNVPLVSWLFLHQLELAGLEHPPAWEAFVSLGLRREDGTDKPALNVWSEV